MKYYVSLLMLCLMVGILCASTNVPAGNVSGSWTTAGSPYIVQGNITIPTGSSLTINPGVIVKFYTNCKMTVSGVLNTNGTSTSNVKMQPYSLGNWAGIAFSTTKPCQISYTEVSGVAGKGAFQILSSKNITVSNCTIHDNNYVISDANGENGAACFNVCNSDSISITYSKMYNNIVSKSIPQISIFDTHAGSVIFSYNNRNTTIDFNTIYNNTNSIKGSTITVLNTLIIDSDIAFVFINDNIIKNNTACSGGALQLSRGNSVNPKYNIEVKRNIITENNADFAGAIHGTADALIDNNIISYNTCDDGGAIYLDDNSCLINNTIYKNSSSENAGGIYISLIGGNWRSTAIAFVTQNNIYDNSCDNFGGGVYIHVEGLELSSSLNFHHNIINNNTAAYGGGLCFEYGTTDITNCVISYNKAVTSGTGFYVRCDNASANIQNSIIWGNSDTDGNSDEQGYMYLPQNPYDILVSSVNYSCLLNGNTAVQGANECTFSNNITTSPQFADIYGYDFHLSANNACATSGNPSVSTYIGRYPYATTTAQASFTNSLHTGWNWVSFPRLDRDPETDASVNTVSTILSYLNNTGSQFEDDYYHYLSYSYGSWTGTSNLGTIKSSEGYKVNMVATNSITKTGTTINPNTVLVLDPNKENWVGYFMPFTMTPEQALGNAMDNLIEIKTEKWAMTRANTSSSWLTTTTSSRDAKVAFNYGDMVSLKIAGTSAINIKWQQGVAQSLMYARAQANNFTYTEQEDYTPIYVTVNSGTLPQEIGVLVNGKCVGAAVVEGDTTEINAYLTPEDEGQEITLAFSYDSKALPKNITDYTVMNYATNQQELKPILYDQRDGYYHILVGKSDNPVIVPQVSMSQNYPNPFNPETTISYYVPKEARVELTIYNIRGQKVKNLFSGVVNPGQQKIVWDGKDNHNQRTASGIYLYQLKVGNQFIQKKMALIK